MIDKAEQSSLHTAVIEGDVGIIEQLLENGADIDAVNADEETPLGLALTKQSLQHLAELLLIKEGARKSQKNLLSKLTLLRQGLRYCPVCTPWSSVDCGSLSPPVTCETVSGNDCKYGFDKVLEMYGLTPFLMAVWAGRINTVNQLVRLGADVTATCNIIGGAVHLAVDSENVTVLERVIKLDCDIDLINHHGSSALHCAARLPSTSLCQALIYNGALLNQTDRNGETALSSSIYFGQEENSISLICHGADLHIADKRGTTPLYWAIFNSRQITLEKLIQAGVRCSLNKFFRFPRNLRIMRNKSLVVWLRTTLCQPKQLQHMCQLRIRELCKNVTEGRSINKTVLSLPLPNRIVQQITML